MPTNNASRSTIGSAMVEKIARTAAMSFTVQPTASFPTESSCASLATNAFQSRSSATTSQIAPTKVTKERCARNLMHASQ